MTGVCQEADGDTTILTKGLASPEEPEGKELHLKGNIIFNNSFLSANNP
jgi:hypothetical protein